jgi:2-alkyl-3-oxoalkanoate reductase
MRIFVAGATGAIGQHLIPALVAAGHQVTATTRSAAKVAGLQQIGAAAAIVDGLDGAAVLAAVADAEPDVIMHQMTSLASLHGVRDFRRFDATFAVTNDLRTRGTDYLLEAAQATGVKRFIAQSYIGWNNSRTGTLVKSENDPLDPDPLPATTQTMAAIQHVEDVVPKAGGIALRYGSFYGPGASVAMLDAVSKRQMPIVGSGAGVWSFTEITDAASAAVAAITRGEPGVYNIVDDDPAPVAEWLPYLAECLGAKRPAHVPVWLGRLIAGEVIVAQMTQVRGSSNAKARRELGWTPGYSSWRDGFPVWAAGVRGAGSPRMGAAGVRGAGSPRWRKSA